MLGYFSGICNVKGYNVDERCNGGRLVVAIVGENHRCRRAVLGEIKLVICRVEAYISLGEKVDGANRVAFFAIN